MPFNDTFWPKSNMRNSAYSILVKSKLSETASLYICIKVLRKTLKLLKN